MRSTTHDRILGTVLLVYGLLGLSWALTKASGMGFAGWFTASNTVLAVAGIAAGLGLWRHKRWASGLGLVFLAVLMVHIFTPGFRVSFTLGISAIMSAGWGNTLIGINVLAFALFVWLLVRTLKS